MGRCSFGTTLTCEADATGFAASVDPISVRVKMGTLSNGWFSVGFPFNQPHKGLPEKDTLGVFIEREQHVHVCHVKSMDLLARQASWG